MQIAITVTYQNVLNSTFIAIEIWSELNSTVGADDKSRWITRFTIAKNNDVWATGGYNTADSHLRVNSQIWTQKSIQWH
jgi:hypothetical protein